MEEEVYVSDSSGGGGSKFLDIGGCIDGCVILVLRVDKVEEPWNKYYGSCSVLRLISCSSTRLTGTKNAFESTVGSAL